MKGYEINVLRLCFLYNAIKIMECRVRDSSGYPTSAKGGEEYERIARPEDCKDEGNAQKTKVQKGADWKIAILIVYAKKIA